MQELQTQHRELNGVVNQSYLQTMQELQIQRSELNGLVNQNSLISQSITTLQSQISVVMQSVLASSCAAPSPQATTGSGPPMALLCMSTVT